jgi:hypothetical protein
MEDLVPSEFFLSQNYPNPFWEKTTIKFCIPYRIRVRIEVFNCEGKLLKKLLDEEKEEGTYEIEFNFFDLIACEKGNLEEGTYFYRLEAGDFRKEKEMVLSK